MNINQAIEIVSNLPNSTDLLLCGIEGVEKANYNFSVAKYYNNITLDNTVEKIFGTGENNKFFYILLSINNDKVVKHEGGIGYSFVNEGRPIFRRSFPIYEGKELSHKRLISSPQTSSFYCNPDNVNILMSSFPEEYAFLFYDKNCLLTSIAKLTPHPVQVLENSFLGRINDSDLTNVSFDSTEFANVVGEAVAKYTKQLKLKCSKLSIKQLQLENNDGHGAKAGTFIYDKETDVVKFYNGTKWRILKWADEEKAE